MIRAAILAGALLAAAASLDGERHEAPEVCHEDMPCWDCETMGNLTCGPVEP